MIRNGGRDQTTSQTVPSYGSSAAKTIHKLSQRRGCGKRIAYRI
jgi:hypothetical protein